MLSGGKFKANVHCVKGAPNHTRVSCALFTFPPTDFEMYSPFAYELSSDVSRAKSAIESGAVIHFSNVFKKGNTFAEFHFNAAKSYNEQGRREDSWTK